LFHFVKHFVNNSQNLEAEVMQIKIHLPGMTVVAAILLFLSSGCASPTVEQPSSPGQQSVFQIQQPPMTNYMKSVVGTPDELSPIAPSAARNVRKVGNQWLCDFNGQVMIYNDAGARWEPK
jgi:hypothetical protein